MTTFPTGTRVGATRWEVCGIAFRVLMFVYTAVTGCQGDVAWRTLSVPGKCGSPCSLRLVVRCQ